MNVPACKNPCKIRTHKIAEKLEFAAIGYRRARHEVENKLNSLILNESQEGVYKDVMGVVY